MDKLKAYGLSTHSLNLIKDYLSGRRERVKVANAKSDTVKINRGVPQGSVLGPLLFNIFLNDLFYFVTEAKLSNYADDNQLTSSDIDPEKVQAALVRDFEITSKWFRDCGLFLNLDKCKLVVLPERKSDQVELCIDGSQVKATDNVELLGVVIDNRLNFKSNLSKLIKKVGRQIDVLNRFKHILSFRSKIRIYRAFIMPHFTYCSSVWNSCLKEDSDRLERLHERALRYVFNDFCNGYDSLCSKIGYSLSCRRKQDMLLIIFKALNNSMPQYIQSLFNVRENKKNLRGNNKLVLPVAKTTTYGLKSTSYIAAKAWNALPDNLRSVADFARFRKELRELRNLEFFFFFLSIVYIP